MKIEKTRDLEDIETKEVSLVGKAANKKKFLFFKSDGPNSKKLKKAKKINIVIDSNGTIGGTKIAVNEKKLKNLRDFNFSFWGEGDESKAVSCSYSEFVETEDGFSRSETFYLSKGDCIMEPKVKEQLDKYFSEDEKIDFEKAEESDVIVKSLETVNEYREDFPDDLKKAVGVIAKQAGMYAPVIKSDEKGGKEDLSKAGAKFSKDILAKLKAIVAATKALEDSLPAEAEKSSDSSDDEKGELKKVIGELTKSIEQLEKKKDDSEKDEAKVEFTKALKELTARLTVVEKGTGVKKSEDGQEDDNEDKGTTKDPFPSIKIYD